MYSCISSASFCLSIPLPAHFSTSPCSVTNSSFESSSANSNKAPSGWALCDGANGTPDLRGRFILGWNPGGGKHGKVPGNDYNQFGGAGGNQIHQLTEGELASHVHNFCANVNAYRKFDSADGNEQAGFGGEACPNTAAAGGNEPHNNMPPYIILAYIMKL